MQEKNGNRPDGGLAIECFIFGCGIIIVNPGSIESLTTAMEKEGIEPWYECFVLIFMDRSSHLSNGCAQNNKPDKIPEADRIRDMYRPSVSHLSHETPRRRRKEDHVNKGEQQLNIVL